jgi:hypothetical protein
MATQQTAPVSPNASRPQLGDKPGSGTSNVVVGASGVDQPAATRGKTSIADVVVVKVSGIAAREIPGVYDMGGGLARTLGHGRPNRGGGAEAYLPAGIHVLARSAAPALGLRALRPHGRVRC